MSEVFGRIKKEHVFGHILKTGESKNGTQEGKRQKVLGQEWGARVETG